jgi:hypothetical protein
MLMRLRLGETALSVINSAATSYTSEAPMGGTRIDCLGEAVTPPYHTDGTYIG